MLELLTLASVQFSSLYKMYSYKCKVSFDAGQENLQFCCTVLFFYVSLMYFCDTH